MTPVSSSSGGVFDDRDVLVEPRVPSARELELRSMRARIREIADMNRMSVLDYPYSRNENIAMEQQYEDMMLEYENRSSGYHNRGGNPYNGHYDSGNKRRKYG